MKTDPANANTNADAALNAVRAVEAVINLKDGETIDAYSHALGDAAGTVAAKFLNDAAVAAGYDPTLEDMGMEEPEFRTYTDDAGADYVVLRASRSHPWMSLCLRMGYTRDNAGLFTFGVPEVVTPKRSYDVAPDGAAKLAEFVGANLPAAEAVEKPNVKQRKNLPAAAFAAPFFAGEDGGYAPGGTFQRAKSKLPFHVNTAKDVDATETVDVPRLRNALARFDQTDFAVFGDAAPKVKATARARLDKAAKALIPAVRAAAAAGESVLAKLPGAPTQSDVDGFVVALDAFTRGTLVGEAREAFMDLARIAVKAVAGALAATESAAVQRSADDVLARARLAFAGCGEPDEIAQLRRRAGAVQIHRMHDVAEGRA